jgi:hypothetical protein
MPPLLESAEESQESFTLAIAKRSKKTCPGSEEGRSGVLQMLLS